MKILILGARGNLGSVLVRCLRGEGCEILAWDTGEIDISRKDELEESLFRASPRVIINTASINDVDGCESDSRIYNKARQINAEAVRHLAQICGRLGSVLVHYSTDYVFDGERREGYNENDKPAPVNKYGETKLMGEKEVLGKTGLRYYLIRTSKLFGPAGNSSAKPHFFDLMLKMAREKDELKVVDDEKSCFTYTEDLSRETWRLISGEKEYGIYHITNSDAATWFKAARELFDLAGVNIPVRPISGDEMPRPAQRPRYSKLINNKTDGLRSYKEALKEFLNNKSLN